MTNHLTLLRMQEAAAEVAADEESSAPPATIAPLPWIWRYFDLLHLGGFIGFTFIGAKSLRNAHMHPVFVVVLMRALPCACPPMDMHERWMLLFLLHIGSISFPFLSAEPFFEQRHIEKSLHAYIDNVSIGGILLWLLCPNVSVLDAFFTAASTLTLTGTCSFQTGL